MNQYFDSIDERYRGYSNVFVKYVFYFTSEVDNIIIVHFTSEIKDIFNKKTFESSFYYLQIFHNLLR